MQRRQLAALINIFYKRRNSALIAKLFADDIFQITAIC